MVIKSQTFTFYVSYIRIYISDLIITVRNVVAARLCFHRRLWFCSQRGEGVRGRGCAWQGACMAGGMHGGGMHGRGGGACVCSGGMHGRSNGHCSGQYASYWNAFLLFPPPPDTTGYGLQAGGTHPTGMHTYRQFFIMLHTELLKVKIAQGYIKVKLQKYIFCPIHRQLRQG